MQDEISEGEAIGWIYDDTEQMTFDARKSSIEIKKEKAERTKVGEQATCPGCGKQFKKKSYQQKFCSNKGRNNCKDRCNNRTNQDRYERMIGRGLDEYPGYF